jgi:choline-sulfatase
MHNQPNIVLCTCDQLRAFEIGCYGNALIQTPNIDRLASEGVRFETAVTNYPVCMASRSVLLSGQYNRTCTGGVGNIAYPTRPGETYMPEYPQAGRPHLKDPTLAEVLRGRGYHNAVIGKWHIHSWPDEVGFDDYLIPRVHHCHTGQSYTANGGAEFVPAGYSLDFEAERVRQFLAGRIDSREPFFLYYNISPPHGPIADVPEEYRTMYQPDEIPIRPNVDLGQPLANQEHWFKVYRWDFRYYTLHLPYTEALPTDYSLKHLIAEYYGATTWMDHALGRMLDALDEFGLSDNTIVVFLSDHGDNLGSHGLVQKGKAIEESIRIPLIFRWPGLNQSTTAVRDQVASLVDIAPTLLSLINAPVTNHFQGRDLLSNITGEASGILRHGAIIETADGAAVRTLSRMYFIPYTGPERTLGESPSQIFNLVDDPHQLDNLALQDMAVDAMLDLDRNLRDWDAATPWMLT